MKHNFVIGILLAALACAGSAQSSPQNSAQDRWQKVLIPDGETAYDTVNHLAWLADTNLPPKYRMTKSRLTTISDSDFRYAQNSPQNPQSRA
jgi:hypothetical protein